MIVSAPTRARHQFAPTETCDCCNPTIALVEIGLSQVKGSKVLAKVNSTWLNLRSLIALHSPNALVETGLCMCRPEKSKRSDRLCC